MKKHGTPVTAARRGLVAISAVALLAALQPFAVVANAAARQTRLHALLDEAIAGGSFSLEEVAILNHFAFGGAVTELEADVVISRAPPRAALAPPINDTCAGARHPRPTPTSTAPRRLQATSSSCRSTVTRYATTRR
jgi:hypothetical protein